MSIIIHSLKNLEGICITPSNAERIHFYERRSMEPWKVGTIMAIGSLLLPMSIDLNIPSLSLIAVLWRGQLTPLGFDLQPTSIPSFFNTMLWFIMLAQFVFVWQMVKWYRQESTGRRAFFAFVISWLPNLVMSVALTLPIIWDPYYHYAFRALPVPLLLLLAMLLVRLSPPSRPVVWIDETPYIGWWERLSDDDISLRFDKNQYVPWFRMFRIRAHCIRL